MKRFAAVACAAVVLATISPGIAATPEPSLVTSTTYDNRHGFDFLFGTWTTHYRILRKRLAHDNVWYDCYGTFDDSPVLERERQPRGWRPALPAASRLHSRHDAASLRSRDVPVVALLGHNEDWPRASATGRALQSQRSGPVLCRRQVARHAGDRSFQVVAKQRRSPSLRTSLFYRPRPYLGNKLDHRLRPKIAVAG